MEHVIFWVLIGVTSLGVTFFALVSWNRSYCFIFERKNIWNKWKDVIKNADKLKFREHNVYDYRPDLNNYKFIGVLNGEEVNVIYWDNDKQKVSVHEKDGTDCILSSFDKYHVRKMRKILKKEIDAFEAGKELIKSAVRDYLID